MDGGIGVGGAQVLICLRCHLGEAVAHDQKACAFALGEGGGDANHNPSIDQHSHSRVDELDDFTLQWLERDHVQPRVNLVVRELFGQLHNLVLDRVRHLVLVLEVYKVYL